MVYRSHDIVDLLAGQKQSTSKSFDGEKLQCMINMKCSWSGHTFNADWYVYMELRALWAYTDTDGFVKRLVFIFSDSCCLVIWPWLSRV